MRKHHLVDAQVPAEPLREAKEALVSPALIDIVRRRSQGQLDHLLYAGWGLPEVLFNTWKHCPYCPVLGFPLGMSSH